MSKSVQSDISKASQKTQQLMEDISSQNESKLFKAQGAIDANTLFNIWASLGSIIQKNLKVGRALSIPKFGTFTFSYPEIDLKNTTNAENREPVFIISKEFGQGVEIKSGLFRDKGLRPLALNSVNGKIQINQLSFNELALISKTDKDTAQLAIWRIKTRLEQLTKQVSENDSVVLEIPCVGTLIIKNGVCAVSFNEFLTMQLQGIFKESMDQRKSKLGSLTSQKLKQLEDSYKTLDEGAKEWLNKNLNINTDRDWKRKTFFAKTPDVLSVKASNDDALSQFSRTSGTTLFQSVRNKAYKSKQQVDLEQSKPNNIVNTYASKEGLTQTISNYQLLNKFKELIKNIALTPEESFNKFIAGALGNSAQQNTKLDLEQFRTGLEKIAFIIPESDLHFLFRQLDSKKDGFIDLEEWKSLFTFENKEELIKYIIGSPQEWIKSVTDQNSFKIEDLLKSMEISKNQQILSEPEIVNGLKRLMKCTQKDSEKISKFILKDQKSITQSNLLSYFQDKKASPQISQFSKLIQKDKPKLVTLDDFNNNEASPKNQNEDQPEEELIGLLKQIKRNLNQRADKDVLISKLQSMDVHNKGYLDIANFKTCLFQSKIGLTIQEIDKLSQLIEKVDEYSKIDYSKFLQRVDNSLKVSNSKEGLDYIATSILNYIKKNCLNDIQKFLHKLKSQSSQNTSSSEGILLSNFIKVTQSLIFQSDPQQIALYADIIDIDKDGFIDRFDLETFLKRYSYIEASIGHQETSQSSIFKKLDGYRVFPTQEITIEQLQRIIRDFKQHLIDRKISLYDSFKSLDSNNDGFITITELNENLQKNLSFQLSTIAKNGLFSYLDYLKIGMFDYPRWHQVLSRITIATEPPISDNFDFQYNTIKSIQQWFPKQNLSAVEAFRMADKDFDGYINKEDLRIFLLENLQINPNDLTSQNMDRLFKLIDRSKKNNIDKNDFVALLEPEMLFNHSSQKSFRSSHPSSTRTSSYQGSDYIITNESNHFDNDNLSWIKSCIQQISLYFSKLNKNIFEQFEIVSNYKPQVTYAGFIKWIEQSDSLNGFNLTDKLLQQLFSFLDPHKKGFITLKDWKNTLKQYLGFEETKLKEIKEILQNSFNTILEGFNYLSSGRPTIGFLNFSKSINNLFPGQYTSITKQKIWIYMIQSIGIDVSLALKSSLDFEQFCKIFEFDSKESQIQNNNSLKPKPLKTLSSVNISKGALSNKNVLCYEDCEKAFKKLRNLLFISNKNVLEEFQKADPTNQGMVSILEFKNILQNLNLGLSIDDINLIIQFVDPIASKTCKYKQFLANVKVDHNSESILKRSNNRITSLRQALYEYMITPKDAFRQADNTKKGYMTFQDFTKFMEVISQLTKQEPLSFQILQDIFDFIDVKGDGIIDLQEWLSAFMKYEDKRVRRYGYSNHQPKEDGTLDLSIDFKTKGFPTTNFSTCLNQKLQAKTSINFKPRKLVNPHSRSMAKCTTVGSLLNQSNKMLTSADDSQIIKSINEYYVQNSINPTQWEQSQEYDKTQIAIARNRKLLLSEFITVHQSIMSKNEQPNIEVVTKNQKKSNLRLIQSPSKRSKSLQNEPSPQAQLLPTYIVQNIIQSLLKSQKIQVHSNSWQTILGFAEKQPGQIDFRFLLDVYKDKLLLLEAPPTIIHS